MNLWMWRKPKPKKRIYRHKYQKELKQFKKFIILMIARENNESRQKIELITKWTVQFIKAAKHKHKKIKKKTSSYRQTKNRFLTCELQKLQNNKWKNYIFQKKLNKPKVFKFLMIAKENDKSRRKREFINQIKLGCLNCQVQLKKKKKKQFHIHISNRILTCTENHRSCKTTNEKQLYFKECKNIKINPF